MKGKITKLVIAGMLALALSACGGQTEENNMAGMKNPITEYTSLDEINALTNGNLIHPPVMGVTETAFRGIDCGDYQIAEYAFEINGISYTMRDAAIPQDISGLYYDGKTAFSEEQNDEDMSVFYAPEWKAARWFWGDLQYVLICEDSENVVSEEQFDGIANEMRSIVEPTLSGEELAAFYKNLAGEYQDRYSQRAVMTVTADGENGVAISGSWGNSASEALEWTMHASLENGLLYYADGVFEEAVYDQNGKRDVSSCAERDGHFELSEDGLLLWTGAGDENLEKCEFEKPQQ